MPVLYCSTEVRLITFRSATRHSLVRMSSCTPSAKYALAGSLLRFSKGKTAIDFPGAARSTKVERPIVSATASPRMVSKSAAGFRQRRARIGRALTAGEGFVFSPRSFSGDLRIAQAILAKVKQVQSQPVLDFAFT